MLQQEEQYITGLGVNYSVLDEVEARVHTKTKVETIVAASRITS